MGTDRPAVEGYKDERGVSQLEMNLNLILQDAAKLLLKKHEAYGPKNISGAPGGPLNGLRVRMWDKLARLNHIIENPSVDTNDESMKDTLMDLLNYCAIAILVMDGDWPQ